MPSKRTDDNVKRMTQPQGSKPEPSGPRVLPQQPSDPSRPPESGALSSSVPRPASAVVDPVRKWQVHGPEWNGILELKKDGTCQGVPGTGKWSFDGRTLTLNWPTRGIAVFKLQIDGTFLGHQQGGSCVLRGV